MRSAERLLGSPWTRAAYTGIFSLYLVGLLLWLALGLVPPLVSTFGPARQLTESVAAGAGPMSSAATAVLMHLPSLPQGVWLAAQYLFSLLNLGLGVLLAVRRPHEPVPQLIALAFIGTAGTFNEASHSVFHILGSAPPITAVHFTFHVVSGIAYLWAVLLFPDGRMVALAQRHPRRATTAAVVGTLVVALICWRSSFIAHPPFFVAFFGVLVPIVGITAQTARLRSPHLSPDVRQQSRILRMALVPALVAAVLWLGSLLLMITVTGAADAMSGAPAAIETAFPALFAVVPVGLFVAILRYRLWEIDIVLSRTLLITLLAGFVGAVYLVVLALSGWALRGRGWSAVVAMAVVALAIEPVRRACSRFANRLVFGQELTPRQALARLADRLTGKADELSDLTAVVVRGTRASSAGLWLVLPERLLLAARTPFADEDAPRRLPLADLTVEACRAALPAHICFPVSREGRLLAVLAVELAPGVSLPATETRLVGDLAHHAGMLVANARLTSSLAEQVAQVRAREKELRASRREVVTAQDAERRRLERDIHDGAQQELVAFLVQNGVLRRGQAAGIAPGHEQLEALGKLLQQAAATLHALSTGRLPPVLAERGLRAALQAAALLDRQAGLTVEVRCLADRMSPAVESVAYFCCREAVQNAAKHANARVVQVSAEVRAGTLELLVTDDGTGFRPEDVAAGAGLRNLSERLAPLGGEAMISSDPGKGTQVRCCVPLTAGSGTPLLVGGPT